MLTGEHIKGARDAVSREDIVNVARSDHSSMQANHLVFERGVEHDCRPAISLAKKACVALGAVLNTELNRKSRGSERLSPLSKPVQMIPTESNHRTARKKQHAW